MSFGFATLHSWLYSTIGKNAFILDLWFISLSIQPWYENIYYLEVGIKEYKDNNYPYNEHDFT